MLPAAVLAQTREEIERQPVTPVPPAAGVSVTVEGEIERAPCPLADPQFQNLSFTLSDVQFANMEGIDPAILRPAYAGFVGQTLQIATVCEIRDRAATILRRAGYLASVQVPPQRIEGGVVRFDVLTARLVGFQVRGNAGRAEGTIAGYLEAIKSQRVFNILEAERYLLLARDIPGYDVRLTLRPAGTVPGEVVGEVLVAYTPFEVDLNVQNYGSKEVGRFGALAQARFNGIFGAGDRTTLGVFSTFDTDEQQVVQAAQEFRLGGEGFVLGGDFAYAWTRPSLGGGLNLRSKTLIASIEGRYPFIRRQAHNLFGAVGLDLIDQRSRFAGLPLSEDNLRVAYATLSYDSIDPKSIVSTEGYSANEPRWRFGGTIEIRQGLGILGASNGCGPALVNCAGPGVVPPSRVEGDPTAFVLRAAAYTEVRPIPNIAFSLSPRVQYAPNALLSYEEFSAGNYTVGRGYNPGTLTGDSGYGVATEVRVGSIVPRGRKATAIQAYGFFDAAFVWNEDTAFNGLDPQKLYSAGGGVRVAFGDTALLDVGGAVPLKRAGLQARRGDARLLVNLTAKFRPTL